MIFQTSFWPTICLSTPSRTWHTPARSTGCVEEVDPDPAGVVQSVVAGALNMSSAPAHLSTFGMLQQSVHLAGWFMLTVKNHHFCTSRSFQQVNRPALTHSITLSLSLCVTRRDFGWHRHFWTKRGSRLRAQSGCTTAAPGAPAKQNRVSHHP